MTVVLPVRELEEACLTIIQFDLQYICKETNMFCSGRMALRMLWSSCMKLFDMKDRDPSTPFLTLPIQRKKVLKGFSLSKIPSDPLKASLKRSISGSQKSSIRCLNAGFHYVRT